jgi:FMN phosphatase YigB (HAD superfamily)
MVDLLGVDPHNSVFVDDVSANLPPATAMGMSVIHHVDTRQTIADLTHLFAVELGAAAVTSSAKANPTVTELAD